MDKDEHFKLFDSLACCRFEQLFSSSKYREELSLINSNENEQEAQDSGSKENQAMKESNSKQTFLDKKNKNFSELLEDQYYSQEILRENEESKYEYIIQYLSKIFGSEEKYFRRKISLFSNLVSTYYSSIKSINKLSFDFEPLQYKYALMPNFSINSLPGMKPSSNWPISLEDLWEKLKSIKLEELFNQPMEESFQENFYNEAIQQIINFDKLDDIQNLTRAICCFLCVLILFGDFLLLFKGIIFIKTNLKNKDKLDQSILNDKTNPLNLRLKDAYEQFKENDFNLYPIMRAYSIVDYFTISKCLIYYYVKTSFINSCCSCTDGTYIYFYLSGIDGCKLKVGTGYNNTEKGKVYLCVQNIDERGIENDLNSNQWVYCNGKIYQKANRIDEYSDNISDNKKEIGNLNIINPDTLQVENTIKLLFPQNCLNDSIVHRNKNYVLLSDGKKLSVLCLELTKENEKVKKPSILKNDNLIYNYLNLELINFDISSLNYSKEYEAKISKQNRDLIEEIYQSFSQIFTKEECFKALLKNNWNPKDTALYLIDNPSEIKQSLLVGDKPIILFQSRIESINTKSGGIFDIKCYNNTYFDIYRYENYKWCIDENFVVAYRLNEGACAIFGRDENKYGKTFNYKIDLNQDNKKYINLIDIKSKDFPKNIKNLFLKKDDEGGAELLKYVMLRKYREENSIPDDIYDELNKDFFEYFEESIKDDKSNDIKEGKDNDEKKEEEKDEKNEKQKENEILNDDITDDIYGTFIKKFGALSFKDRNYIITYDCINKVHYIIWSNFTQLNSFYILISDTFQDMNQEYKHLLNFEGENSSKTINYFESLFSFTENSKINLDEYTTEILNMIYLFTSAMKYESNWRYKNWSFFYNYLNKFITNRQQELNNSSELSSFLFPIDSKMEISNKTLSKRIDKFDEISKKLLLSQLGPELNDEYKLKYIISMENKKKSSIHCSPNIRHIGSWESTSSLMFKYKYYKDKKVKRKSDEEIKNYVLSYENKKIYLTNKRIFFLGFKGDITEINYLLEILKKKKENKNYLDFITLEFLFKLIYIWISNIESALILTNKDEFQKMINDLNSILKEYYCNSESDNEIKKLIRLIIIEGWNELNPTIEQQIFWFKDFYNYNKNTDEKEILSQNDYNLEYYTLKNYEKYPFYCLLKKLDYTRNSLSINNNFNKINIIKSFSFYPIVYKDKYRLIALSAFHGFSSINMQLPFYWSMFNYNIDHYQRNLKKKIKPIIIEDYKGTERYSTAHKGLVVDYKFQKINKIIYDIVKLDNKLVLIEDIINEANPKVDFEKNNKEMMDFFRDNFKDNKLINLMNKLFILCFGETIHLYKKYFAPEPEENNNNNNDDSLLSKEKSYLLTIINKNNNISENKEKPENNEKEIDENIIRKNTLKKEYKNSFSCFYKYLNQILQNYFSLYENINENLELLKLNYSYIYFLFYGIKNNILINQEENMNLFLSLLKKLNNYEPNSLSLYNELGTVYSNARVYEYYLNKNDIVNINHTISYENNNELFCVELELQIPNNEKVSNKDILVISNYHGYKNLSFYLTNNIRAYGTSFVVKFNQSFKKILFLKGSEIRIVSPSETFKSQIISSSSNTNKNGDANSNNKSLLKIKVYPFNNHCINLIKNKNKNLENNISNLALSVTNIEEIESYLSHIFKDIIKSTNNAQNETENILVKFDILKLGLKDDFYKKVDAQFEKDKNKYTKNNPDESKLEFIQDFLKSNASLITFKDIEDDSNIALSKKVLSFIRKVLPEPIGYSSIKKLPSFKSEIKQLWEKVEILILYAFLYHLNLISDYKDSEETFDNVLDLILGKRLNTIMASLANKALLYKEGFDLVKYYYYDFEEKYNKLYEEIKQMIISDIYKSKLIEDTKNEKKEDEKDNTQKENANVKEKKAKKKSKLEKLEEKFGSKGAGNYKKKSNVHRTLPKEKKKKTKIAEKETNKDSIEEEKLKKQNEEKERYNNLNAKSLDLLIKEAPEKLNEQISEKLKILKEEIVNKTKKSINEEVNSSYFGNKEKLKSICKLYNIEYNDNNPNESIEKYSNHIYNELLNLIEGYQNYIKIIINEEKLKKKNPFVSLAEEMIYKVSLLLNLNNYNENDENDEFNIQLSEKMKSFNNSYSLALHSNNSSSFQNISASLQNPSDENYILDAKNQYILKTLLHFILKYDNNVNNAIIVLYSQYIRSKKRVIGICNLSNYLKKDLNCLTNYNYGLLSLSLGKYKNGLINGIESNNKVMNDTKNELISLLDNNIGILMNIIKELDANKSQTNDKIIINISKEKIESNYIKNNEDYLIKKMILILSDIRIILKYISTHKRLFEEELSKKNLEKFIEIIFNTLMNRKKTKLGTDSEKTKKLIRDLVKIILNEIVLLNVQKNTDYIFGYLYNYLCAAKDKLNKKNILDLIRDILLNYNKVNQNNTGNSNFNADSNIVKISSKLLEMIELSNSPELINLSSQIIIYIYKSISSKGKKEINNSLLKDTEILFKKIGKLFMFGENNKLLDSKEQEFKEETKTGNYYVLVQMNSTEFDYQFLVNALFYWEEKYPTELSKYKYESDENKKDKNEAKVVYNPTINVENKYNVKPFNYFITEKGEKGKQELKMTKLNRKVQEKIDIINKSIDAINKENKDPKTTKEKKEENSKKLKIFLKTKKYYDRISSHIVTAEQIGEIASIKGYVILLPKLPHKKALELCDLFYKAQNRLLKHFSVDVEGKINETLFNDDLIYPPLPSQSKLFAGLTTTLKETTKSNLNFTLITEKEYNIISETYDYFSKELKLAEKREKSGKYHDNYMLGYTKDVISNINYNSYEKKIIDEEGILTGKCITIIIQSVIELLYNIYELNSTVLTKLIRNKLKQIKTDFNFNDVTEENMKIIGMFLFINDFYNIIRQNTKVTNSNTKDGESKIIGKVINGGDKSGSNICKVCFSTLNANNNNKNKTNNHSNLKSNQQISSNYNLNEEDIKNKVVLKIENVNINSLNKLEENEDLLKYISLNDIFNIFIIAYENFKSNAKFNNQILLNLSLKLLNNKKIENSEISRLYETDKAILTKVINYLQEISDKANWLEKKDRFWESEFIDAFERLQNKFNIDNKNLIGIYSPIFHDINREKNIEINQKEKKEDKNKKSKEDLIINYNMPKSDFISELPQLKDYSKITSCLRNIIIFERYFVGEIYNYCKQQYNENDYINSLSQIRYQLAFGNIDGLKNDMSTVFDNGKIPITGLLFKDEFDLNEIFVEEIYPNNYYCVRNNKVDNAVLVLLQDYTIASCLCLIFDDYRGKMYTEWINNEEFKLLQTPIKIPSFSFNSKQLIEEYNYIEKKLRILYSKNSLFDIMLSLNQIKSDIQLKDVDNLSEMQLDSWKKYKLNPTSGVFNNLNNFISMKNSPKVQKILSESKKEQNNLNDLINKSLLGLDNDETNKNIINNDENKINKIKTENIKKWVMKEWKDLDKNLKTITVNLYKDYIEKSNILFSTPEGQKIYHVGDFNYRLIALHELVKLESDFDTSDICGLLITFKTETFLEANAKLTFYSDPYGENVIGEISSFKTNTSNLQTYIFNFPKVWVKYTPGTRCFYIFEWSTVPIGSNLPCLITAIPCNWPLLIEMTDNITDDIFNEDNQNNNENINEYKKLIHLLINHCTSNQIPSEIQRRIFNITTRTLFKYKQYLKINDNNKKELSIEEKIDLISTDKGKDLVELIKKVEKTSENKQEKNEKYYSSYVVEGVEIILAILSIIKGPNIDINVISNFLKNKFNYNLPVFIETIYKLNQLIDFINESKENKLEETLIKEMKKENDLSNFLYNNILILKVNENYGKVEEKKEEEKKEEKKEDKEESDEEKEDDEKIGKFKKERIRFFIKNIKKSLDIEENKKLDKKKKKDKFKNDEENKDKKPPKKEPPKEIIKKPIKEILFDVLKEHEVIIVNSDNDILEFNYDNQGKQEKYIGISFEGFILSNKYLKEPEIKKVEEVKPVVEEEEPFWQCFYCQMENDKNNSFCVFCDKDKKVIKKEKPKPKPVEEKNELGIPDNYEMVLKYYEKKMNNLKFKLKNLDNSPFEEVYFGEDIISLPDYPGPLTNYLCDRINKYKNNKDFLMPKLSYLKQLKNKEVDEIIKKLSDEKSDIKLEEAFELTMNLLNNGIDIWFENTNIEEYINSIKNMKNLDISLLAKISTIIDNAIISNQIYNKIEDYALLLPSNQIRSIYSDFNSINQISYFSDLNELPLNLIRYYWSIIKYYNNYLKTSLPFIKPPSPYKTILKNSAKNDYILVPLHETITTFLSNNRGLIFNSIKTGLLNSIIDSSEYSEEEIQIPKMKFERLDIANNIDKKKNDVIKMMANNINFTDDINEQNLENINIKNLIKNNLTEKDSLFLQAFSQYKYYDISSYRAKKFPGDPKLAFQVIFINEFVQGLGGPYRQFFSDISKELNEYLPLIIETQNNINKRGEFKDLYTINPSYNGINALDQYEFLGILMGICIRTGVHLTLDLCSLVWKQLVNEKINLEDILQFDEGLYNMIKTIYEYDPNKATKEKKSNSEENEISGDNNPINKEKEEVEDVFNYNTILSDGTLKYFNPNNKEKKELILSKSNLSERLKYISMLIYNRLNEAEIQINSIKTGLSKIIPLSILQLFTGKELSLLVCGKKDVDIDLLRHNTKLSNDLKEDSKEVRWLWEILNEITPEEKIKFIKFCWAQERLPTSNEEYVKNQIAFTIKYNKNNKNGFPRADTCFFNLELPNYSAKNIMKKNLLIAIGLDNNSMNADKITGVNSMNISSNQRDGNREDNDKNDDYDDNYDDNYPGESGEEF